MYYSLDHWPWTWSSAGPYTGQRHSVKDVRMPLNGPDTHPSAIHFAFVLWCLAISPGLAWLRVCLQLTPSSALPPPLDVKTSLGLGQVFCAIPPIGTRVPDVPDPLKCLDHI